MKKLGLAIITLGIMFGLSGCNSAPKCSDSDVVNTVPGLVIDTLIGDIRLGAVQSIKTVYPNQVKKIKETYSIVNLKRWKDETDTKPEKKVYYGKIINFIQEYKKKITNMTLENITTISSSEKRQRTQCSAKFGNATVFYKAYKNDNGDTMVQVTNYK